MNRPFAILLWACALAPGADWLTRAGDLQRTGWQKEEKLLTAHTVQRLQLLWKRKLSTGSSSLTDPLLLGPIITHRGIKELVFVKDSSDTVYAVDADLGTVFWSRHVGEGTPCAGSIPIAPVMAPSPEKPNDPEAEDDDTFSDANRPLYVLSSEGRLYALRPSTGGDFSLSLPFLPPSAKPASLEISDKVLYATTAPACGGLPNRFWTLDLKASPNPQWRRWKENSRLLTVFKWKGQDVSAELNSNKLVLLNPNIHHPVVGSVASSLAHSGGLATWQDAAGTRWIDTTSTSGVRAFQITGPKDHPTAIPSWASHGLTAAGPPAIANGILYFLSYALNAGSNHLVLHAIDALNGVELYNSGNAITSRSSSGNIALANGHVCFSAVDGVLYCFGLSFEM